MSIRNGKSLASILVAVAVVATLLGCAEPKVIADCEPAEGVTPLCGLTNPEDLVEVPGGGWLITGEMPHLQTESPIQGRLMAVRIADHSQQELFPGGLSARGPVLGDPACPGPPEPARFAPHGLDLAQLASGRQVLAVVNHGEQERVDLFDVDLISGEPRLAWAGCVPVPTSMWPNDVVLRQDGSLVVSKMLPGPLGATGLAVGFRLLTGGNTGAVYGWSPGKGWSEFEGSQGSAPNGIAVSPDGRDLFFAEWGADRLVRLRRSEAGQLSREVVELPHHPDNLSWTSDSQLLSAGQVGSWQQMMACQSVEQGTCGLAFSVVRIDPETLATEEVLVHSGTAMGSVSSALAVGDTLYLGSFSSDRMARAPYTP